MNFPETQEWLDEMGEPTAVVAAQMEALVMTFSAAVGALDRQISQLQQTLQASDMVESDAELRAMYEAGYQKLNGQRRQLAALATLVRATRETQREIATYAAAVRQRAAVVGYVI